MSDAKNIYRKLLLGAGAGLIATLPMTVFMRSAWKRLPPDERYALPPRQITRQILGWRRFRTMEPGIQTVLTLLFHFLFGAAVGSIYGMVEQKIPMKNFVKGSLAGLAVWAGSYLGWIPALGILPPASRQPLHRNGLMILAHLIWGLTMAVLARLMKSEKTYITIQ